ncbi:MAG: element excision factor XisH family protein [Microcoleus sp.]
MSAKDIFHNAVRSALEKEGWIITHDPLFIKVEELDFFIDLAGEKILAAEKDGFKIAVEIKSFIGASDLASLWLLSYVRRLVCLPYFLRKDLKWVLYRPDT